MNKRRRYLAHRRRKAGRIRHYSKRMLARAEAKAVKWMALFTGIQA
jgi:hypothetical protein